MSDAYFVTGLQMPAGTPLETLLQKLCESAGIRAGSVNEIHHFTDAASALFQRISKTSYGPILCWPLIPYLETSTLFSVCRALELGEISTCILAECSSVTSTAILLASPTGVGRLNLSPHAHLAVRFSSPISMTDPVVCAHKLLASMPEEESTEEQNPEGPPVPQKPSRPWMGIYSREKPEIADWSPDRLVFGSSIFTSLINLVTAMNSTRTDPGVWINIMSEEPGASLLVLPL
ncbi:hypothetical protein [Leptolinea tardivitalis]|uniref:Uncharacterized protein n=1 Tax=Leptolinea tardivitalis TaxID=229920 RepID=A0A0N8GLM8_9CHLR|nr:hypothetical protein [Leptolinea tardivitalis]KPL72938.1 hypothetical protein ADM99_07845 [Leptolinea tardivitalis]GAP20666.1 hypothetical protein LTAR_00860 [Leptolinea tardivitalis]